MRWDRSFVCLIGLLAGPLVADAQEWTRFRGPNGSGVGVAPDLPVSWKENDYAWKTPIPPGGRGSVVLWGEKLFLNSDRDEGKVRSVMCLDSRTGAVLWTREFSSATGKKHKLNSFASSTPACDERHVYATWGVPEKITLVALTHTGETAWEADLGTFSGGHGYAVSPMVYDELVVLGNDQDGESSLIAVDRMTGEVRWETPRRSDRATYSTPCVYQREGRPAELIFTEWRHGITAVDPKTGKVNWEISVFLQSRQERAIASPVIAGDLVIGSCGFTTAEKQLVAVRPGNSGQPDDVKEIFRIERSVPHIPTSIVYQDRLYLWADNGVVTSFNAKTGEQIWMKRANGNYFGSPVAVNGKLYCVNDAGETVVLAAGDEFTELARNPLGELSHCTPAIANGMMFFRTENAVLAIGPKK